MTGEVGIRLVKGIDAVSTWPGFVARAGLDQRIAVVQDTYVEGCPDMHFEAPLWLALIDFMQGRHPGAEITVAPELDRPGRVPLPAYLERWRNLPEAERECPAAVIVRDSGRLRLCLVTDPWCDVGGPDLYHDAYAHSLYADEDLTDAMRGHLLARSRGRAWAMTLEPVLVGRRDRGELGPSRTGRGLRDWLLGLFSR